ncbi:MAG: molybdopterin-binding protein [Synergistaceae bacterium]|nr:molybdopterin-binding protein [Synergistaceae bacterium]
MKSRTIAIENAVGTILSHDLTLIDVEIGYKGARFKKGHVVVGDDVELLKRMGREHLSILELDGDDVHEDDAALRVGEALRELSGESCSVAGPSEGKCSLIAEAAGLLLFDEESVHQINVDENWVFSTLANKIPVFRGETVAAWRVAPLVVKENVVRRAQRLVRPFELRPFLPLRTALVTTGREIWEGKVKDAFLGKLEKKLALYGAPLIGHQIAPDDGEAIRGCIEAAVTQGAEVVFCTGGMSVDADDRTPAAIRDAASEVVFRWTPVLPGSNFMLAKKGPVVLLGVPACAVHSEITVLDTVMHRIYAGLPLTNAEVRRWGVGGLCRGCGTCNYPTCSFGSRP